MDTVRFGIVGLGGMGRFHLNAMESIKQTKVTALADIDETRVGELAQKHNAAAFTDYRELLGSGLVDAVVIATPHYQHPEIALAGFEKDLHVLTEKPAAVTVKDARRMNEAHARHPQLTFGIMFQLRTTPMYMKMREIIAGGDLGEISRITWIATNWFRTWAYYASGGWRATWEGEGGGVLINQCPHNLDLLQWITGLMPRRVTAVGSMGKTHPIEVEDEISAILEYDNGAIGHFIATTGEAPGTDRLEICGDRGKLVAENGKLRFSLTRKSVRQIRETSPDMFGKVEAWDIDVPLNTNQPEGHNVITQNFVNSILKGEPLIAPGEEGAKGLEIGNAMLMAGLSRQPVELPMDGDAYEAFLKEMAKRYGGRKKIGMGIT